jgi:hypothetical protein
MMIPKHIQNLGFLKIGVRSCTTTLLKADTLKKIRTKEYKMRKYQLVLNMPFIKTVKPTQAMIEVTRMEIKVARFLLNKPQLWNSHVNKQKLTSVYALMTIMKILMDPLCINS